MKNVWWVSFLFIGVFSGCIAKKNKEGKDNNESKIASWEQQIAEKLPLLGHRNWILVVDKAFPMPASSDVILIDSKQLTLEAVKKVLLQINKEPHVKAVVYTDLELAYLKESWAPGVNSFKSGLQAILGNAQSISIPHAGVLAQLDQSSQKFKTVVIKTEGLIPYSSVFIQLDCKYWSATKEDALRNAIKTNGTISK